MSPCGLFFAAAAEGDLALIEAQLANAYQQFGESAGDAARHAEARIDAIMAAAERLATAPL